MEPLYRKKETGVNDLQGIRTAWMDETTFPNRPFYNRAQHRQEYGTHTMNGWSVLLLTTCLGSQQPRFLPGLLGQRDGSFVQLYSDHSKCILERKSLKNKVRDLRELTAFG